VFSLAPVKVKAADRISLNVKNKELGAVAEFVQRMTGTELLIPASSLRKRVNLKLEEITFGDALKELELVPPPEIDFGPTETETTEEEA
jgi:type II secretory pathway component GspD/PulD (secretin)